MAWVSTRQIWRGRGGSENDGNERLSDKYYRVTMSDPADDEIAVAYNYGGPVMFDPHPTRPRMWVQEVNILQMDESALLWIVHIHYSSEIKDPNQKTDSPLDKPITDEWGHAEYSAPCVEGYLIDETTGIESSDLAAIVNSAGEAFDPPEDDDATRITIATELNLANPPAWILQYNGAINDADITVRGITFPKYTLRVRTRVGKIAIENGVPFRSIFYDLEARAETFLKRIPDRGYNYVKGGKPKKITINGSEPTLPPWLNGAGLPLGIAYDAAMTSGSNVLAASAGSFSASDVGNAITIKGAGASGADLVTTIQTFVNGGSVDTADNAGTTVSGAFATWISKPHFRTYRGKRTPALPFSVLGLPP